MTEPPIEILRATEADLSAIRKLAGIVWRAHYPGIISPAQIDYMLARMYSLDVLRDEIQRQDIRFERMLMADQLVGFASFGPAGEPGVIKLHKLYVHPDWHGRGLGSRLLQHCERAARERNAERLILAVNKRNLKAIATYERNGFSIAESVVTDIGGGFVMDDFIMARDLNLNS